MWHRGGIREILDRALANESLNDPLSDAILQNLEYSQSDHQPILMYMEAEVQQELTGPTVLRFEAKWLRATPAVDPLPPPHQADLSALFWANSSFLKQIHRFYHII